MSGKVPLVFRIFRGTDFVREERLELQIIKIGTLSSSHLRFGTDGTDDGVSRMHAVIEVGAPGEISIIDLGSRAGTFVNGQKVNKAKLQAGDEIVVGNFRMQFSLGDAEVSSEQRAATVPAMAAGEAMPARQAPSPTVPPVVTQPAAVPAIRPVAAVAAPQPAYAGGAQTFGAQAPVNMSATPFGGGMANAMAFAGDVEDAGTRSVEVTAMLGSSVMGVRHVIANAGIVSSTAKGMLAAGGVLIAAFLASFMVAASVARANAAAFKAIIEAGEPAFAFRPVAHVPIWANVLFVVGLVGGVTFLLMGLNRYRREKNGVRQFRIGSDADVEFPIAAAPSSSFPLVAPIGDDYVFNFAPGVDGEMILDGQAKSLASLASEGRARPSTTAPGAMEVPLPQGARIKAKVGQTQFIVTAVNRPKEQPLLAWGRDDGFLPFFGGTLAAAAGIILLFWFVDPAAESSTLAESALTDIDNEAASDTLDQPPPPEPETSDDDGAEESGGTGTAMALDEGKMGKKESDRATGQYKMAKTQENEQLARMAAVEKAATAGILGSSALQTGSVFASLTGTGDVSSGFDDVDIQGGLLGTEAGEMQGGFGFGRQGFGPGGGGTGWGTIGTGNYGTIGHGSGTGTGYGVGGGRGGGRGHTAAVPTVKLGQPSGSGDLDKAIIKRYIARNKNKFQYCYEKELQTKPNLSGTVNSSFLITANGSVPQATASGVDGAVSSCVATVLKGIQFPAPKGGGAVQVNYPFSFSKSGT